MKDLKLHNERINDLSRHLKPKHENEQSDEMREQKVAELPTVCLSKMVCSPTSGDPSQICESSFQNDRIVNQSKRERFELLDFEGALKEKYSSYLDTDSCSSDKYIKSIDQTYDLTDIDNHDSWSHASESEGAQISPRQFIPPEIAMMHLEAELLLDAIRQGLVSPRTLTDNVTDNTHYSSFSADENCNEEDDSESLSSYISDDDDGMKGEVQKLARSVTSLRIDLAKASLLNIGLRKSREIEEVHQLTNLNHFKILVILVSCIFPYRPSLDMLCGALLLF